MAQTGPGETPTAAQAGVENVAALILQATQSAAQAILDASVKAAGEIATAGANLQTNLMAPPSQGIDADALVTAFEAMQSGQFNQPGESDWGGGIPLDPRYDVIVDSEGTRWNPDPGDEPMIPSMERESFAVVPPGTPILPHLPRLDQ